MKGLGCFRCDVSIIAGMSRRQKHEDMTEEELRGLLKWAEQQGFLNVAEALRRALTKVAAARHLSRPLTLNSSGATLSHAKNEPTGRQPTS